MSWLVFAFSGPVLWAISTHFDKYLVERYFKHSDVAVLLLFTAFIGVLTLPFIVFYEPTVFQLDAASMALIALSGILYMGATLFYLRALQSEEASVVAPFFQAVPLLGYALAYFVLGETLSIVQMTGGALIIVGTLIVSVRFGQNVRIFKLRLVLLMLACCLAAAISGLIFKAFAVTVAFWTTTFWMFVGEAIFGTALLLVGSYRRQLAELLRVNAAALLAINGSNELINLGGGLGNRYARHRAGNQLDDSFVRVCILRRAQRCLAAAGARDLVRSRSSAERRGRCFGWARRGAGNTVDAAWVEQRETQERLTGR